MMGIDHVEYGALVVERRDQLAAAMSVGRDPSSPSLQFKGPIPNEDALGARDDGRFARLVVADSHFGHRASEVLVDATLRCPLESPDLSPLGALDLLEDDRSDTTLTVVWLDRLTGVAKIHWFGDSLALRLRRGAAPLVLIKKDTRYVHPGGFDPHSAGHARCPIAPKDLIVLFSDGVDECHYHYPETSIGLNHIAALFTEHPTPADFVTALAQLALTGVDGNPGGQDNIAIVAVQV